MDCEYIDSKQHDDLNNKLSEIGMMLNGMMQKTNQFCGALPQNINETEEEYLF